MVRQHVVYRWLTVGFILTAFAGGCSRVAGPERSAVGGEVTFNGQPVDDGHITFNPTGDTTGPATGGVISVGRYSIDASQGPVVGTHRIEIRANRKTGRQIQAVAPASGTVDEVEQFIPAKYNSDSVLRKEIKPGTNRHDFPLTAE